MIRKENNNNLGGDESKPKKVLLISSEFPPGPGGIGNHAYNLAYFLGSQANIQLTVVCSSNHSNKAENEIFDAKQPFVTKRIYRTKVMAFTYFYRVGMMQRLAKAHDFIMLSGKFSLWMGGLSKLLNKGKTHMGIVHGSELDLRQSFVRKLTHWSVAKMDQIVSVSEYTSRYLPPKPAFQVRVIIPNGINPKELKSADQQQSVDTKGKPSLLTVGNVTPRKGQLNMIEALPGLIKQNPEIHYHIVGLPSHQQAFEKEARALGVLNHITFHGKVSREALMAFYANTDIFIMLSDHTNSGDFEGFGIAVLEANCFGKPAIGSRESGIADAISHEKTGMLVNQKSPREVAAAISVILKQYDTFSEYALKWSVKHDWQQIGKMYITLINATLK